MSVDEMFRSLAIVLTPVKVDLLEHVVVILARTPADDCKYAKVMIGIAGKS